MTGDPRTIVISPNQPAGFLLQSGMFSIRDLREDAQRPAAPPSIRADWQTIESWLECRDRDFTDNDQARIHEALLIYFTRGKAPSLALEEPFQFFVKQLEDIKLPQTTVPDAVFAVFDRLYATDAQIAEKRQVDDLKANKISEPSSKAPRMIFSRSARTIIIGIALWMTFAVVRTYTSFEFMGIWLDEWNSDYFLVNLIVPPTLAVALHFAVRWIRRSR